MNKKRNQTIGKLIDMGEDKRETEQREMMLTNKMEQVECSFSNHVKHLHGILRSGQLPLPQQKIIFSVCILKHIHSMRVCIYTHIHTHVCVYTHTQTLLQWACCEGDVTVSLDPSSATGVTL